MRGITKPSAAALLLTSEEEASSAAHTPLTPCRAGALAGLQGISALAGAGRRRPR